MRNNTAMHNNQDLLNTGTWRGELSNSASSNNTWVNNIAVADPSIQKNNTAIDNTSTGGYVNKNIVWSNNLTFNGTAGQASVRTDGGNAMPTAANGNKLGVDPLLVNPAGDDYHLRPGSPAINAGTNSFGLGVVDLDGGARSIGTVDIGADEYGSGSGGGGGSGTPPAPTPNTAPVARDDGGYATAFGTAITIQPQSLLANDTDANDDELTITSVSGASGGTVRLNGGNVVFTPGTNVSGPASFDYTVSDGKGGTDTATVSLSIGAQPISNAAPVARDDGGYTTAFGTALTIQAQSLLANDTDSNGDALTIASVSGASGGTVRLNGGSVVFTPGSNVSGPASFDYTVSDGKGGTDTARVTLGIGAQPDVVPPPAVDNVSFWDNTARPAIQSNSDSKGVELGLKFLVETDGEIEGLRFYKGTQNTGTHTGTLWDASGRVLATATFGSETSTGWQEVTFSNPVDVSAGETFVASYYAPRGHYSVTEDYFSKPLDVGSITALSDGGVYSYGARGSFPDSVYKASNYWVDVVFDPDDTGSAVGEPIETSANPITGTSGNDRLYGTSKADELFGGNGDDRLYGNSGNDTLHGEDGNDYLRGHAGRDFLIGGKGADRFDYNSVSESMPGSANGDVIKAGDGAVAFEGAGKSWGDRIDVSGIDANTTLSGNQAFVFGSTAKGGLSLIDIDGNTLVRGNIDNTAAFEFEILIVDGAIDASAYTAADFIL